MKYLYYHVDKKEHIMTAHGLDKNVVAVVCYKHNTFLDYYRAKKKLVRLCHETFQEEFDVLIYDSAEDD